MTGTPRAGAGRLPVAQVAEWASRRRAVVRARLDYLTFVYGASARWLVAFVVSVLLLGGPLLPRPFDLILTWAGVAAAVIALVELLVRGVRSYLRWTRVDLVPRPDPFPWDRAQWTPRGVRVPISAAHDGSRQVAWRSADVDEILRTRPAFPQPADGESGRRIRGAFESSRFRLTRALSDIGGRSLRHRSAKGGDGTTRALPPARFNGHLVRLASEPTIETLDSGELVFQHVRYFDGESSNEVWPLVVSGPGGRSPVEPYVADRRGRILSLDQSRAANILGISLFALTSDDRLVLVRQSARNSIAPGAYASSSSGSADPEDFGVSRRGSSPHLDALAGIMTGMLRELREESLVRDDEIDRGSAVVTGYYRWLDRGAKPEFAGAVHVRCASTDLTSRSYRGGESTFTEGLAFLAGAVLRTEAEAWAASTQRPQRRAESAIDRFVDHVAELDGGTPEINPSCVAAWLALLDFVASSPGWALPPVR